VLIGLLWLSIGSSGGGLVITVKTPGSKEMAGNFLSLHLVVSFSRSTPLQRRS
jgi:hypothetical protein